MSARRFSADKPSLDAQSTEPQSAFQRIHAKYPFIADGLRVLLSQGKAQLNILRKASGSTDLLPIHERAWQQVARELGFVTINRNPAGSGPPRIVITLSEDCHASVEAILTAMPKVETASDDDVDAPSVGKCPFPSEHVNLFQIGSAALRRLFALAALLEKPGVFKKQRVIAQASNLDTTSISKFMMTLEEWGYVKTGNAAMGELKTVCLTPKGVKFTEWIMKAFGSQRIAEFEEA